MLIMVFFFFKQKTAYELRISDWSSDVCSSDLLGLVGSKAQGKLGEQRRSRECNQIPPQRLPAANQIEAAEGMHVATFLQPELDQNGRASCRERVCQSE